MKVESTVNLKVKMCPLCASEAFLHTSRTSGSEPFFWIKCNNLECGCTVQAVKDHTLALNIWNRRG